LKFQLIEGSGRLEYVIPRFDAQAVGVFSVRYWGKINQKLGAQLA
jgi:hypothetical protein